MKSFLDLVVDDILKTYSEDFSEMCIVFPTRRAGLIFRKKFAARLPKPAWAPSVMAIQDFISTLSPVPIAEDIELLFELYEVNKHYHPETSFEKFFHWGEMMLNDFNEIDLQLVPADKLFSNISDLKRIETEFGLGEEDAERIAEFWKNFSGKELSKLKTEFKNTWESLGEIYHIFRKTLLQKGKSYEGMAYRHVLEQLQNNWLEVKWEKVIFAGFYALSLAHEQIIEELKKKNKAEVIWDADTYYTENNMQEAGNYFRKKKLLNENFRFQNNYFEEEDKTIEMTGVPLQVGQAKYLGNIIGRQIQEGTFAENKTAIVLPDENLLFPVLYSLPAELNSFNVTMGYPLKKSLVSGLVQSLFSLHKHLREKENSEIHFYSHDIINLFEHPYVLQMDETFLHKKINEIKHFNKIFCSAKELIDGTENENVKIFFRKLNSADEVFQYIIEVLKACAANYHAKESINKFDAEILQFTRTEVQSLYETIKSYSAQMSAELAWEFIRKAIDKLKIPFSGEPVQGLQVMGFLETRVLDFENLFILSVNEDVLPASSRGNSYIPYSLRKGFGLPTFEEQDAVYAYHFYRLLQRAKNIHLIYNTEVKSLTGGEKSRFLLQISYEMKKKFGEKIHIHYSLASTDIRSEEIKEISITKSPEVMGILSNHFVKGVTEETIGFSASALSTYINCPLQFYFRYVAQIKESETVEENIEADTFGKILHGTMQKLYGNVQQLTSEKITELQKKVDSAVNESFSKEFSHSEKEPAGVNYLLRQVILELVKKILETDKAIAPFTIEVLEGKFEQSFKYNNLKQEVVLKGIFDRVDGINGFVRIVDYKTGSDELNSKKGFEDIFSNPKLKATFQLYYYSYIYKQLFPSKEVQAGIYRMKSISEGIAYLNDGNAITELKLQEFENSLENLISEIMNPEISFSQTTEVERCKYCPYKEICNR